MEITKIKRHCFFSLYYRRKAYFYVKRLIAYNINTIHTIIKKMSNRFTLIKSPKGGLQVEIKVLL